MKTLALMVILATAVLLSTIPALSSTVHGEALSDAETNVPRTIPATVWYQGFLADVSTGDPINDTYDIKVQLYDSENGGGSLWGPETHVDVTIIEGWFHIELGVTVALPAFDNPPYYLQLTVDGESLAPRQKLGSTPTALRSNVAEQADDDWTISGSNVYRLSGNVGIGDSTPTRKLDVNGDVSATTYYGDGSNLTGVTGSGDNDWAIDGDNITHLVGRVGIGTLSPENTFHITGAGAAAGGVPGWTEVVARVRRNGSSHTGLSIDATAARDGILYLAEDGRAWWSMRNDVSEDRNLEFRFHGVAGTVYGATIDSTGRWGLGTRSPTARFQIQESSSGECFEAMNTASSGVSRLVNIERTQPSSSGNDMLQIKMASGSDDGAEFIECERGSSIPPSQGQRQRAHQRQHRRWRHVPGRAGPHRG